jgi:hypothetical protein
MNAAPARSKDTNVYRIPVGQAGIGIELVRIVIRHINPHRTLRYIKCQIYGGLCLVRLYMTGKDNRLAHATSSPSAP